MTPGENLSTNGSNPSGGSVPFDLRSDARSSFIKTEPLLDLLEKVSSNVVVLSPKEVVAFGFSAGAYAGGSLQRIREIQATQNPDEYFRNNGKLDKQSLDKLAVEIANLPEAVPGFNISVLRTVQNCHELLLQGAGLTFTYKIFEIFAYGKFLQAIAGDDFIEDPAGGFIGRLRDSAGKEAVERKSPKSYLTQEEKEAADEKKEVFNKKIEEVYYKTHAIYGRNLSLYALRSLEALYMLQNIQLDARICKASGHFAVSGSEVRFPWTNVRLSMSVWKSKFETISRVFNILKTAKMAAVTACKADSIIDFLSGRDLSKQELCLSSLSHTLSARIAKWADRQDRFVENVHSEIDRLQERYGQPN